MKRRLERLMTRYGQRVELTGREEDWSREMRAFLQPAAKRRETLPASATPLGAVSRQRWIYVGSGDQALRPGDRVVCGELRLVVQEAQLLRWQDGVLCCWAILRREKEAAV